ncbi:hypothetical protein [Citrobacter freundii]|uniref:hypothetical protein n=1 Tax=Citrobacter freundii TaxID=546 RepID=UPI00383B44C5
MERQTPFISFNKNPRSIRLVLTELFSGRVFARLAELEDRVFELERRINAQAIAIANLGTTVGMEKIRGSVVSRVMRGSQVNKDSSHGKLSTKSTEANGLRSNFSNSGSGSSASLSESIDIGISNFHHTFSDDTPSRTSSCLSGWDVSGHDSGSSCSAGSSSCCD